MAYFNHAFNKLFLGTGLTQSDSSGAADIPSVIPGVETEGGFVTTSGVFTYQLNEISQGVKTFLQNSIPTGFPVTLTNYSQGYFGIFDPKTNQTITPENCCNIYFAGSTIYPNDKIGPFHGGYQETNKSKMVNPRYVQKFYRVDPCLPKNEVVHIGSTAFTAGGAITDYSTGGIASLAPNLVNELITLEGGTGVGAQIIVSTDALGAITNLTFVSNFNTAIGTSTIGKGYEDGQVLTIPGDLGDWEFIVDTATPLANNPSCCKEFLCGETYYLRVDIKGSPALRFLNHNAYYNAEAYTGCCPADSLTPTPVDSTEVMIKWANALVGYELVAPFLQIIVQDEQGVFWYEPGTSAADLAILGGNTWDKYVSPGHVDGACAGLIINGAYVDTKFGDCSFQISDFYEKEPVRIFASEVDLSGDPCAFDGLCVIKECEARQAQGLGETVLRDLILSEQYRQNFFSTDIRIREITQGNQMLNVINRSALYTKYYLLHNVPRFNNPTGVFDNDRYLLEFVTNGALPTFEQTVNKWLSNCGTECAFEEVTCVDECETLITFPPLPPKARKMER